MDVWYGLIKKKREMEKRKGERRWKKVRVFQEANLFSREKELRLGVQGFSSGKIHKNVQTRNPQNGRKRKGWKNAKTGHNIVNTFSRTRILSSYFSSEQMTANEDETPYTYYSQWEKWTRNLGKLNSSFRSESQFLCQKTEGYTGTGRFQESVEKIPFPLRKTFSRLNGIKSCSRLHGVQCCRRGSPRKIQPSMATTTP